MLDLIAVGDVLLDVLGPDAPPGRTHAPVVVRAGGSAANVARQAARQGCSAGVVGCVGDDPAGKTIAGELRAAGIELRLAVDPERPTGCLVQLGERVVAERGANAGLAADHVGTLDARVVVVSGYALLHGDTRDAALTALAQPPLACVDLARAGLVRQVGDLDALLAGADVVVGDGETIEAAGGLERLAAGRLAAVATLGADGAIGIAGDARSEAAPPRLLPASPVGAGDAFAAALMLALAGGLGLAAALAAGCAAGCAVEHLGTLRP
ncbi:MAG TPA: PfkB family carbohydrate kinase [Gaiellaceae bacterium]